LTDRDPTEEVASEMVSDIILYGEIQDVRIAYFADMILNSVNARN
jgi:hypothetical protein